MKVGTEHKTMQGMYFQHNEENVDSLYYDAMELLGRGRSGAKRAEKLLMRALEFDEHNVQTHVGFAHVYGSLHDRKKAAEAYQDRVR